MLWGCISCTKPLLTYVLLHFFIPISNLTLSKTFSWSNSNDLLKSSPNETEKRPTSNVGPERPRDYKCVRAPTSLYISISSGKEIIRMPGGRCDILKWLPGVVVWNPSVLGKTVAALLRAWFIALISPYNRPYIWAPIRLPEVGLSRWNNFSPSYTSRCVSHLL